MGRAIRVAVQLPQGPFDRWAQDVLAAIGGDPGAELAGVLEAPGGHPPRPRGGPLSRRAFAAYAAADRRVFAHADDPLAAARRPRPSPAQELGDVDVVLVLGPAAVQPLPATPRCGVWVIRFGTAVATAPALAAFWAMARGEGAMATSVEVAAGAPQDGAVLAQAWTAVDPVSLRRSLASAARTVPHVVRQALHRLRTDGAAGGAAAPSRAGGERLPRPPQLAAHCARLATGFAGRRLRERLYQHRWHVLVRPRAGQGERAIPDPDARDWRPLLAPRGRFWADPFVLARGGRHWLFVEEYSDRSGRAAIACAELRPGRPPSPELVFAPDHHVSYPFVFEHGGEVFMLPESAAAGSIALYRAHDFPRDWRLEHVLVPGIRALDPTLLSHEGRFWLFAAVQDPRERYADELWLWWAADLAGPWHRHPLNPVLCDVRSARPAGALFHRGGALIRPGQDCSRGYGHAITLKQVETLSPMDYREREIGRIEPGNRPSVRAVHSLNADDAFEVIDVNRRLPRAPLAAMRRRAAGARTAGRAR